jgi:hypothetical protein
MANGEATMTELGGGSGADLDGALAYLVINADESVRTVPVFDQLFVGRECAGISDWRRLVIDDPEVSRSHLEDPLGLRGRPCVRDRQQYQRHVAQRGEARARRASAAEAGR